LCALLYNADTFFTAEFINLAKNMEFEEAETGNAIDNLKNNRIECEKANLKDDNTNVE
jgi:23S rRNA maturation-related 3'-5' exoribonuclease YhaM